MASTPVTAVEIKAITPTIFDSGFLRGVVSLRWPYSSSKHSISIQLADEDIRKRSDKGQVKLTFNGSAAKHIKDLPALSVLEIATTTEAAIFSKSGASARESDYSITFVGEIKVKSDEGAYSTLDSSPVAQDTTPAKVKRTWITQELKRSIPSDELGLEESWFSDATPDTKRKRYASSFKFIDSTQVTPAKSPRTSLYGDETSTPSQTLQPTTPSQNARNQSDRQFSQSDEDFTFQTPFAPVRFEVASRTNTGRELSSRNIGEHNDAFSSQPSPSVSGSIPQVILSLPHTEDDPHGAEQNSRASSVQGEPPLSTYELHGTPRTGPSVHFDTTNHGSAPPTPRNVPYMSLESASEQEDLYRKLRASAPPKSDAGSSMVGVEDDDPGDLAEDPKPTILETQSRVQEGILRRKISDDNESHGAQAQHAPANTSQSIEGTALESIGPHDPNHDENRDLEVHQARSMIAAYGNSLDGADSGTALQRQTETFSRLRETSPSMTERGAAVQESVFRSKIKSSDADTEDQQSTRSVKSSIFVEPAAASTDDGSVHENVEETMLDRQASVQETLFRAKLNRPDATSEAAGNLSTIGQAPAPSSDGDVEVVNEEPTMMQQQNDVQENIFREKLEDNGESTVARYGPRSLDHMEVNETADVAHLLQDQPLQLPVQTLAQQDQAETEVQPGSVLQLSNASENSAMESTTHGNVDQEDVSEVNSNSDDRAQAQALLRMELEAEPTDHLPSDQRLDSASDESQDEDNDPNETSIRYEQTGAIDSSPIVIDSDDEEVDDVDEEERVGEDSDRELEEASIDEGAEGDEVKTLKDDVHAKDPGNAIQDSDDSANEEEQEDIERVPNEDPEVEELHSDDPDEGSFTAFSDEEDDISEQLSDLLDRHDNPESLPSEPTTNKEILGNSADSDHGSVKNQSAFGVDHSIPTYGESEPKMQDEYHTQALEQHGESEDADEEMIYTGPSLAQMLARDGLGDDAQLDDDEVHHDHDEDTAEDEKLMQETAPENVVHGEQSPKAVIEKSRAPERGIMVVESVKDDVLPDNIVDENGQALATSEPVKIDPASDHKPEAESIEEVQANDSVSADHTSQIKDIAKLPTSPPSNSASKEVVSPASSLVTESSFYECLKRVRFESTVDVLGVICDAQYSKTNGPDYIWSASIYQGTGQSRRVSIFRPFKESLPRAKSGDVVLLRNFKVLSFARDLYLRSQEDSAWAVLQASRASSGEVSVTVPGPPVEYSSAEIEHARVLSVWWTDVGHKLAPTQPPARQIHLLNSVHEGLFFDMRGEVMIKPGQMTTPFIIYLTDYSRATDSDTNRIDSIASLGMTGETADCLFLPVELRLQDARYAFHVLEVGDRVSLENVLARMGTDGKLYGSIEPELSGSTRLRRVSSDRDHDGDASLPEVSLESTEPQ
ncbi:Putative uncharacterized protein [Taphrina deformans PYCC 5710]|uniref:Telomeric single stranded DNA binding POT1/Cdc13 domain-containing protein n=1 Tax=Taphrina deformans (strain PYCC 5710 / ATCC 11124 / CBS 356.35 / IMI 108563 / JCM 9778 / NBRC 8474) TaxID=1097556 RepID=R4X9Z6_TAPDE|nr:Putative uncharacterized protein [Taphrina deformans PYCC 5710]|eukprot:CCG82342.1 Putative uncharacterized protein [Taphrina deformans PYCC 5710]